MNDDNNEDNIIKVILVGDSGVGKTSLINSFYCGKFTDTISTQTSYFVNKRYTIDQIEYDIQVWDTPGQERYRSLTKLFLRGSNICILVYDITHKESFLSLDFWIETIKENLGDDPIIAIVGNKSDLYENEEIDEKDLIHYAESKGALYFLESAKTRINHFSDHMLELVKKTVEKQNFNINRRKTIRINNTNLLRLKIII